LFIRWSPVKGRRSLRRRNVVMGLNSGRLSSFKVGV